jgi:peptidoglycan/xylan/chitin deacetylase (PgdA/CDA1 family)
MPSAAAVAMREAGWEVASHGYRWLDYRYVDEATERVHLARTVAVIADLVGERPFGHYQGRPSPNTRRLVVEDGGFLYDSESYADDLPYWTIEYGRPHLIIPYVLDTNDARFLEPPCMATADHFFAYLRDAFERLYEEGRAAPRMMSVGLHGRIAGRPGRAAGLARFLDYVLGVERVWVCRRVDIARHWHAHHPYR